MGKLKIREHTAVLRSSSAAPVSGKAQKVQNSSLEAPGFVNIAGFECSLWSYNGLNVQK